MTEKKAFIVLDSDFDRVFPKNDQGTNGLVETKAEAIEVARARMGEGGRYAPYSIFEMVAVVKTAQAPVTIVEL